MARLKTQSSLIKYIKSQLGEPLIVVDATEDQIIQIINDAIQHFTEYAYGDLEASAIIELGDAGEYLMPDLITNILKLSRGGNNFMNFNAQFGGYVPDLWSEQFVSNSSGSLLGSSLIPNMMRISSTQSMIDKFFGDDINYNFNANKQIIQLMENCNCRCVLNYEYEYIADVNNDLIYNHEWIKRFTIAKTKFLCGTVTGKFDSPLIGNSRVNYADMKAEATMEMEKLEEELLDKWSDPAPVDVC